MPRNDSYDKNDAQSYKNFHLSIDDTINTFRDITDNEDKYSSIFENRTLKWIRALREKTGGIVSFYVFFSDGEFSLMQCTT